MKRMILAAVASLALMSPALAGQCPADMAAIDAALATNPQLSDDQLAEVKQLRQEGEELHNSGNHGESVETLAKAKEILGIN